jgi:fimbrial chaperone protein
MKNSMSIWMIIVARAKAAFACAVVGVLALAVSTAHAGNFSVSPVRVYVAHNERAASLTIVNTGDTELAIDTELFDWKQKPGGAFDLKPTDDLIVAPPQMRIPAKGRQVIRVARVLASSQQEQKTYRILVRELPQAARQQTGYGVQLSVHFSIPIFFTPRGFKPALTCALGAASAAPVSNAIPLSEDGGKPQGPPVASVRCENGGNAHALVASVALLNSAGEKVAAGRLSGYVLPTSDNVWAIFPAQAEGSLGAGRYTLLVTHDDGTEQKTDVVQQ